MRRRKRPVVLTAHERLEIIKKLNAVFANGHWNYPHIKGDCSFGQGVTLQVKLSYPPSRVDCLTMQTRFRFDKSSLGEKQELESKRAILRLIKPLGLVILSSYVQDNFIMLIIAVKGTKLIEPTILKQREKKHEVKAIETEMSVSEVDE